MSEFLLPADLGEALAALDGGQGRIIAGGTDLMVQLREAAARGQQPPALIVDVSRLAELRRRGPDGGQPFLGAGLTFAELADEAGAGAGLPMLARAAASVGSRQVRNTATIGGNVANASPAADGVTVLTALDARVEIASADGVRRCPIAELITAPNRTTLAPGEVVTGFRLSPPPAGAGQVFAKVGRRRAVSIARLNLAVCLDPDLSDPRVVLGACFPSPRRLAGVEALLRGGRPGPGLWREAGEAAAGHFTEVCGWRSSAEYKVPAVSRVMARALAQAWELAGGGS